MPNDATVEELEIMNEFLGKAIQTRISRAKKLKVLANPLDADIDNLEISVRLYNVLKRQGCRTIFDVLSHSEEELKHFRNMGIHAFDECKEVFGKFGKFKEEEKE